MLEQAPSWCQRLLAILKLCVFYLASISFVTSGIGYLVAYTVIGGVLMIMTGIFILPITRAKIESRTGYELDRMTSIGIFALLYLSSSVFAFLAVDISNAPSYLRP